MIKRVLRKVKRMLTPKVPRFDLTGERVDIIYGSKINFDTLDMFQKSHYKRYEHALTIIRENDICGDFACGTGYGSVMLAGRAQKVIGADINGAVIKAIQKRYKSIKNVQFLTADLLNLSFAQIFDKIVSFETIEHFTEENIRVLLAIYNKCLKPGGRLIVSTPYMQERNEAALKLGHHLTFYINENTITDWLAAAGFEVLNFKYQNYDTHIIEAELEKKDFIIFEAGKKKDI